MHTYIVAHIFPSLSVYVCVFAVVSVCVCFATGSVIPQWNFIYSFSVFRLPLWALFSFRLIFAAATYAASAASAAAT